MQAPHITIRQPHQKYTTLQNKHQSNNYNKQIYDNDNDIDYQNQLTFNSTMNNLFAQANQFIMPQTSLYDFFDYLAGQKLQIPQQKALVQQLKITFKHIDSIPQKLWKNKMNVANYSKSKDKDKININGAMNSSKTKRLDPSFEDDSQYKPIFLREIKLNSIAKDSSLNRNQQNFDKSKLNTTDTNMLRKKRIQKINKSALKNNTSTLNNNRQTIQPESTQKKVMF